MNRIKGKKGKDRFLGDFDGPEKIFLSFSLIYFLSFLSTESSLCALDLVLQCGGSLKWELCFFFFRFRLI